MPAQIILACKRWPNNDGGMWCDEHRLAIPEGACDSCPHRKMVKVTTILPYSYERIEICSTRCS